MVIWGQVVRVRTAAGCVGRAIDNRLSPTVKGLPPSAKTCHDLPRPVRFSSIGWLAAICRHNEALRRGHSISRTSLRLGQVECPTESEIRSVASDLLPGKEVEGHSRPVTVCHIHTACRRGGDEIGDGRRFGLNKEASSGPQGESIVAQGEVLGFGAPSRLGSRVGAIWGLMLNPMLRLWRAPSGLCGSFRDRFPGRCPGLRWGAPLVLRKMVLMKWSPAVRGVRRGPRPAPNTGTFRRRVRRGRRPAANTKKPSTKKRRPAPNVGLRRTLVEGFGGVGDSCRTERRGRRLVPTVDERRTIAGGCDYGVVGPGPLLGGGLVPFGYRFGIHYDFGKFAWRWRIGWPAYRPVLMGCSLTISRVMLAEFAGRVRFLVL